MSRNILYDDVLDAMDLLVSYFGTSEKETESVKQASKDEEARRIAEEKEKLKVRIQMAGRVISVK